MQTLTITKGLPGSGKSYWAKKQNAKRVNKDDLRDMIDDGEWSREHEKLIVKTERIIVDYWLGHGYDVIVDNTHLGGDHEEYYKELSQAHEINFVVKDFTDVPLETCIDRDKTRPKPVGEAVIRKMYKDHLAPTNTAPALLQQDPNLPKAIICDIDGTLAHMTGRSPYDYSRVHEDEVDETIKEIVNRYYDAGVTTIVLSGREKGCWEETSRWLDDKGVKAQHLIMRDAGDHRKDSIVKRELFDEWVRGKFNVLFVLDDRQQVVDMWRELGLKCLQVQPGDF